MGAVLVQVGEAGGPVRIYIGQVIVGCTFGEILSLQSNIDRFHTLKESFKVIGKVRFLLKSPAELIRLFDNFFNRGVFLGCTVESNMGYGYLTDLGF